MQLHLGLRLDELASGNFDDAVIVYDSTGVLADARVAADDLGFTATVVSLGVEVGPGSVVLDRDGAISGGPNEQGASVSISLPPASGGYYPLNTLTPNQFDLEFDAAAGVDLPVSFNLSGPTTQSLRLRWSDLLSPDFQVLTPGSSIDPLGGNQIVLPDFQQAIDGFDISDGIYALAAGLEGLFGLIDDYLGDEILGVPVPVIGAALDDLVNFVDNFRGRLSDGLDQQGLAAEAARLVIFDTLGPGTAGAGVSALQFGPGAGASNSSGPTSGGLNILADLNGDGQITLDDVSFTLTDDEASYRLRIAQDLVAADTAINLDLGTTAVGLDIEGDVAASLGYSLDVGFGISESDGVFVEFFDGDEISLDFNASIDDLLGEGRLGPLGISARTLDASELTAAECAAARLVESDPSTEAINAVRGEYQIDLGSGRFSVSDLSGLSNLNVQTRAAIVGSLHLQVETMIGGDAAGLPSLRADVHINWDAVEGSLSEVIAGLAQPNITLTNVGLDLGSFISDVVAPVLAPINEFLDPIRPVLDAITTPIPVLSDIAGEVTFTDLIGLFGDGAQSVGRFVEAAADIARLIDIPIVNGSIFLPLGNFDTAYNSDGTLSASESGGAFGGMGDFDSFLGTIDDVAVRDYLQDMPRTASSATSEPGKFSVPLLTNPASAIGLLLGQDVDLIKYQAPRLEATFEYNQYIPIWPIFGITVGGSFSAVVDFAFGYDTAGIRRFAETQDPIHLLDGFYLDDLRVDANENVIDVAELQFRLGLLAGGQLNLLAVQAGVEGGVYAGVDLNLNDPNHDGKVRFQELADNLALGSHPLLGPLWIFDASGKLEAGVSIYAKAVGFKGELNIGPFTILDFDIPRPEPAMPVLGHKENNGTLVVHVGPNAELREQGDLSDGDEEILISFDDQTNRTVVSGFGRDQSFAGVTRIFIDSGAGADKIVIDESFTSAVEIIAGSGADQVQAGGGPATIQGGSGDDVITGSTRSDNIDGGSGNDVIDGREGDDTLRGGSGDDQIRGAAGADRIHGDVGNDTLSGGDDSDRMFGGDGDDVLSGDAGDDLLVGEAEDGSGFGNDFLQGGTGADRLEGGPRDDELYGNDGSDELFGGTGNDLLVGGSAVRTSPLFANLQPSPDLGSHFFDGGSGNDLIYGTAGIDVVVDLAGLNIVETYESGDAITLGAGDDRVFSGDGEDTVDAGDGDNRVFTGSGFDIVITGTGSDLIDLRPAITGAGVSFGSQVTDAGGQNQIFGDSGDDLVTVAGGDNFISVGDGNNRVTTGAGDDVIRSGNGNDTINAGGGDNDVTSGGGNDVVDTGSGADHIRLGSGDDVARSGGGNDIVLGDGGNDFINTGAGDDFARGGSGDDVLVGERGSDTLHGDRGADIVWGGLEFFTRNELTSSLRLSSDYSADTSYAGFTPVSIVPSVLGGLSISGVLDDGDDLLLGGDDRDIVFGGGGNDQIRGGGDADYLDGGAGSDEVLGEAGADIVHGGDDDDDLRGGAGIDLLYGDDGDDLLRGDSGDANVGGQRLFGQKLFGGPGDDTLFAFAPTLDPISESALRGDRLDGGDGVDAVLGNLRQETLIGGAGDDVLEGDGLAGPNYGSNPQPLTNGGGDELFGDLGDDLLIGGGGDDKLWGGGDTDLLEGHAGIDMLAGGGGIDFLRFDVDSRYAFGGDTLDGHLGNSIAGDTPDDNATDILVIPGTTRGDTIILGGNASGQLVVDYSGLSLLANIRDVSGAVTIEQFQVDGLGGNDSIGFSETLDLSELAQRSRDWVAVFNGGSGDDTLTGSAGRDRLSGGPGSDVLSGLGGDDRLWGDDRDGSSSDLDVLYAGTGNDDLVGGSGDNRLYAWSSDPALGDQFGIFVDPSTGQRFDSDGPGLVPEATGLNRMLGAKATIICTPVRNSISCTAAVATTRFSVPTASRWNWASACLPTSNG